MNHPAAQDIEALGEWLAEWAAVGSRRTASAVNPGADYDWLVLIPPDRSLQVEGRLTALGYTAEGAYDSDGIPLGSGFRSFRRRDANLIITTSPEFYSAFMAATSVATLLGLQDKSDRVALFRAVLYHEQVPEFTPVKQHRSFT